MIESIQWIQKIFKSKRSTKSKVFPKKTSTKPKVILTWLIDLTWKLLLWVDWVGSYVLSSMIEWIDIFRLYRFMVIASMHFHILPRLNWLIWHESYTSLLEAKLYVGTHPTCLDRHTFSFDLRRHRTTVAAAATSRRLSLPQTKVASAKRANWVSPFSPMLKRRNRSPAGTVPGWAGPASSPASY